jgi:hypothetical protein
MAFNAKRHQLTKLHTVCLWALTCRGSSRLGVPSQRDLATVSPRGQANQINTSGQHVRANVLPRARQAPGIVSGFWMTDMAGTTLNVMVFESEDAARSVLEPVRTAPRPPWMQVESADVYEVLAHF